MQHSRSLVVWWLWACLWGVHSRNRVFLRKRGLECPTPVDDQSWTDLLEFERSRPGHGLLCRWTQRFSLLARAAVPGLLSAFLLARCDLRCDLAAWLSPMRRVPPQACSLAIALGLWRALLDSSSTNGRRVGLKEAMSSLVDYLLLPPSHGLGRASSPRPGYDGDSRAGRSPPSSATGKEQSNEGRVL